MAKPAAALPPAIAARLEAAAKGVDALIAAWEAVGRPQQGAAPCDTTAGVRALRQTRALALARLDRTDAAGRDAAATAAAESLERMLDSCPME